MKALTYISRISDAQIAFGNKLGLDLNGSTEAVARAKIEDLIDSQFYNKSLGRPTPKQIALAGKFGYEISMESRRVGEAVIDDIMQQLNHESIRSQHLAPGVIVKNRNDTIDLCYTISSIHPDGTVYFKGGNGRRAWARSLLRVS